MYLDQTMFNHPEIISGYYQGFNLEFKMLKYTLLIRGRSVNNGISFIAFVSIRCIRHFFYI